MLQPISFTKSPQKKQAQKNKKTKKQKKSNTTRFNNNTIKQYVPEFNCKTNFAEGIKQTINWFEADPTRQTLNPIADSLIDNLLKQHSNPFSNQ